MALQLSRRNPRIRADIGGKIRVAKNSTNIEKNVHDKNTPRSRMMKMTCVTIQGRNRECLERILPRTIRKVLIKCVIATIKLELKIIFSWF